MSTVTQQAAPRTKAYDPLTGEKWRLAKRMSSFYVLLIPPVVLLFIFHYIPIYGAVIAFKDFHYGKGILGSPWNDFLHFERLFQDPFFLAAYAFDILGMEAINLLAYPPTFRGLLVVTAIWQGVGWGAIIYLAALSSIDESLYESFLENGLTGLAEQEVVEGFRHPQRCTSSRSESTC